MYAMQPITFATGAEIQAPYRVPIQPGNIESGVALGPASRAIGEPLARHVSQPGMVWAKFAAQNTRAVDQYDPGVYGALETQWTLASNPYNTLDATGNYTNTMAFSQQVKNQAMMQKPSQAQLKAQAAKEKKAAAAAKKEADKAQKAAAKAAKASTCSRSSGTCSSCQ